MPNQGRNCVVVDTSNSPHSRLRPLSLAAVRLDDGFWAPRRRTNREISLPTQFQRCESTGRLDNFRRAAGRSDAPFQGRFYNDSDVSKWLEAACWSLGTDADPSLEAKVEETVALYTAAQDGDGYLDTFFTRERAGERWINLAVLHELYCAGHLIQAAVAHHRVTGRRSFLDVAVRLADHIAATFGPGRRQGADGHPEIEMALVELSRETGEGRYLRQAAFFLDQRGQTPPTISGEAYHQDHAPVREQSEAVGHAVRALYLYGGMADLYAETGEPALREALERLWASFQERKRYITGGAGARYEGEAFGADYELPNERAYAETCAAIAAVMWDWRMLLIGGEARFADSLEVALYNGVLSGGSLSGDVYFYENPLADRGGHRRVPWFGTACCPPNLARTLASLPGYFYATSAEGLWLHLYGAGSVTAVLGGDSITLTQTTEYPWRGEVDLRLVGQAREPFSLFLRIPAWTEGASLAIDGAPEDVHLAPGSYAEIRRAWKDGDHVRLILPMPVRQIASHPHVTNNLGRVSLVRGPIVYCLEQADHPGVDVWDISLPAAGAWTAEWRPDLLGGVVVLRGEGRAPGEGTAGGPLYRPYIGREPAMRRVPVTAVPYCVWANRAPGPMQVWIPVESEARRGS